MASAPLAGSDASKHRWSESKVYTRKLYRGTKLQTPTPSLPTQTTETLAVDDGSSSQPPHVGVFNSVSDESSSRDPNIQDPPPPLTAPSAYSRHEDRVTVNMDSISKTETRDLREKFASELDQVREMVKKVEDREIQVKKMQMNSTHGISPVIVNGKRGNFESGSGRKREPRTMHPLSISVHENNHGVMGEVFEKEKRTPKANQYYRNSEFLLAKDKIPPPDKKTKSHGSKKHGTMTNAEKFLNPIFKNCSSLLSKLMKHKLAWVFNSPVDAKSLGLHDYYFIIKHPMDLGTVKDRLNKNWYKSPREFAEDVRLTFRNAMTYNPKGQDVHYMAEQLLRIFEEKWATIETEYNFRLRLEAEQASTFPTYMVRKIPSLPPPIHDHKRTLSRVESINLPPVDTMERLSHPPPSVRTPAPKKPKAKDPNKRDMTFEEKQKLGTNLQNLPPEKLENVVQIIKKRNSSVSQNDEEIEVDIDSVDAETLWELDRFVTNYKKSLSKSKRKAQLAIQSTGANLHAPQVNPVPSQTDTTTRSQTDRSNQLSAPIDGGKCASNVSGSSSSSTSSSDSGSSSSDSDSDSSSGSDSDVAHSPRS